MKAAVGVGLNPTLSLSLNLRRVSRLLTYALCALLPLALLHLGLGLGLDPFSPAASPPPQIHSDSTTSANAAPPTLQCDYSSGTWVPDPRGPLYNGSTCATIKDSQNCMAHGRPDTAYLHWRWRPALCALPRFDPHAFLRLISHRHLAFVGDSLARNQAESLMCLLASASQPQLVYRDGAENRHRRWIFPSHNATVSIYWSPFLVRRIEKREQEGIRHNSVFLDALDQSWIRDFHSMDVVAFSLGHWFLIPGIYYHKDQVIGCHVCPEFNHTEIGFFDVFRKALRTTLEEVRTRHALLSEDGQRRNRLVTVTTFTQAHFEGEWDKAGSCSKTEPYRDGQVEMEYTTAEMHRSVMDALESFGGDHHGLQFQAVDVTRLALLRPDGHPGPYMYPDPFGNGKAKAGDRVQNDCVHWCMPGPVDTFNEILWQRIAQSGLFS